jgi:N-methylhydantoinase B
VNETLYRVLKDNIRFPESSLGDMKSQMAACRLAVRRLDELFGKYGKTTILDAIAQIFDETERKCRNVVEKLKDGVYEASARFSTTTASSATSRYRSTPRSRSTAAA